MKKRETEEGYFSVEKEGREKPEQSKVLEYSSRLLEAPIKLGQPGHDKIYMLGRVSNKDGEWCINVESSYPTAVLNENIADEFGIDSPVIDDIRKDKESELKLISGGSFVWINEKGKRRLILFRRGSDAPTDPGCLTGPAGRCGELPKGRSSGNFKNCAKPI